MVLVVSVWNWRVLERLAVGEFESRYGETANGLQALDLLSLPNQPHQSSQRLHGGRDQTYEQTS